MNVKTYNDVGVIFMSFGAAMIVSGDKIITAAIFLFLGALGLATREKEKVK